MSAISVAIYDGEQCVAQHHLQSPAQGRVTVPPITTPRLRGHAGRRAAAAGRLRGGTIS